MLAAKRPLSGEEARRPVGTPQHRYESQLADRFRGMQACCLSRRLEPRTHRPT
jgi:hypothetical protein